MFFFFNDTATTEIYTLSLHDALPIWKAMRRSAADASPGVQVAPSPPDQSSADGSRRQSATRSLDGHCGRAGKVRGAGSGAPGDGSARQARQNAVNTLKAPAPGVAPSHGSNRRLRIRPSAHTPPRM